MIWLVVWITGIVIAYTYGGALFKDEKGHQEHLEDYPGIDKIFALFAVCWPLVLIGLTVVLSFYFLQRLFDYTEEAQ